MRSDARFFQDEPSPLPQRAALGSETGVVHLVLVRNAVAIAVGVDIHAGEGIVRSDVRYWSDNWFQSSSYWGWLLPLTLPSWASFVDSIIRWGAPLVVEIGRGYFYSLGPWDVCP